MAIYFTFCAQTHSPLPLHSSIPFFCCHSSSAPFRSRSRLPFFRSTRSKSTGKFMIVERNVHVLHAVGITTSMTTTTEAFIPIRCSLNKAARWQQQLHRGQHTWRGTPQTSTSNWFIRILFAIIITDRFSMFLWFDDRRDRQSASLITSQRPNRTLSFLDRCT